MGQNNHHEEVELMQRGKKNYFTHLPFIKRKLFYPQRQAQCLSYSQLLLHLLYLLL